MLSLAPSHWLVDLVQTRPSVTPTVKDLAIASFLDSAYFAVVDARAQHKKDGTPFLRARLRDSTGVIEAVAWDNFDQCAKSLIVGKVVKVRGQVGKAYN